MAKAEAECRGKPGQVKSFYKPCSQRECTSLATQVAKDYSKKVEGRMPLPRDICGLDINVLKAREVKIIGELGTYKYNMGKQIEFKRCQKYTYHDRHLNRTVTDTCTQTRTVPVPEKTLRCYGVVKSFLRNLHIGAGGRPVEELTDDALALVACSRSQIGKKSARIPIEQDLMTPAIIAGITQPESEDQKLSHYQQVRDAVDNLVRSGKLAAQNKVDVINERQLILPRDYQVAFDQFVLSKGDPRRYVYKLFGKYTGIEEVQVPTPPPAFRRKRIPRFVREGWEKGKPEGSPINIRRAPRRRRDVWRFEVPEEREAEISERREAEEFESTL